MLLFATFICILILFFIFNRAKPSKEFKNAYFLSHNGMGDNLFSIGALRFLLQYYEKIYFLCKDKYYSNVHLFFSNEPRIVCIPFNSKKETEECERIINSHRNNHDIFICGCHKKYLKTQITNKKLLKYTPDNKGYTLDYDTITSRNYSFIFNFYKDIHLDLSIFYDYFHLESTKKSKEMYQKVKKYNIIFLQTTSSDKKKLNIVNLTNKYINDPNTILLSNDENLYNNSEYSGKLIESKKSLAEHFVMEKIVYYLDTIKNSSEIYIIDSCFTGIILPLKKTGKLKADIVRIIRRSEIDKHKI